MSQYEHKSSPYSTTSHNQTATMSRSRGRNGGKDGADDATHIRLLQKAFEIANKTGCLEKNMLTPAVCRTDAMKLWRKVVDNNVFKGIFALYLAEMDLDESVAVFLSGLLMPSYMASLSHIDLSGNFIGDKTCRAIAALIAPKVPFETFSVKDNLSINRYRSLSKLLKRGLIATLNISNNGFIEKAGWNTLAKAMCISDTLNMVELQNCCIKDEEMKVLLNGMRRSESIRVLNVGDNEIGDLAAEEMKLFLLKNASIETLNISKNRLSPEQTMEIAKGLTINKSVKNMKMNCCHIGARGIESLAMMLINNHSLEELELSYNEIFNDGVQVLAQGLVQNYGLKRIVLWYNGLDDAAARQLANTLHQRSAHFRNDMVQSIAESQPDYFFIIDKYSKYSSSQPSISGRHKSSKSKLRSYPETYPICEKIVDYLPVHTYYPNVIIDICHNNLCPLEFHHSLCYGVNPCISKSHEKVIKMDCIDQEVPIDMLRESKHPLYIILNFIRATKKDIPSTTIHQIEAFFHFKRPLNVSDASIW